MKTMGTGAGRGTLPYLQAEAYDMGFIQAKVVTSSMI